MSEIKQQYENIKQRLKEHDAARKIIEGELLALQHICPHEDTKEWYSSGWGRMPSDEWRCQDCGLAKRPVGWQRPRN